MSAGYYKRRRGALEHIESGKIDILEDGIHDYLNLKANLVIGSLSSIPVGICFTSAPAIHAHCKRVSERTIQRCLSHLEAIGWIKTFRMPNQRGNYPALICRASVHDLSGNEYRINAAATTDWRHPVYEAVGQLSPETSNAVLKLAGNREVKAENGKEAAKPPSPGSPYPKPIPKTKDVVAELWDTLGLDPARLGHRFRKHSEDFFLKRGDQSIEDFLEVCLDAWEVLGNKIPAPFARAVASFRERQRTVNVGLARPATEIPELEAPAWAK